MNKKITFLVAIALVAMLFVGCATTVSKAGDFFYGVASTQKDASIVADILGPVYLEKKPNTGWSYADIFNEARRLYPNVDEVVNIHVDYSSKGINGKTSDIMTGIAIKYKR